MNLLNFLPNIISSITDVNTNKNQRVCLLKTIAIASNLHPIQKRYLIAHGLGHHLFHQQNSKGYIRLHEEGILGSKEMRKIEIGRKERQADLFASYLLIPEEKLNKLLNEEWMKDSSNPISELAEEFQVPEELMRRRLEFEKLIKGKQI